ncbi:MAG: PTS sugar transporter subunit IIA [Planctomycetes bacterium]|nr:PTS sugar transporter subunit IIA [Planctomycetota bacterium]
MLTEFIRPESIKIPLESPSLSPVTKEAVIAELVALLPEAAETARRDAILKAVLLRERQMSTGIGNGVAIPHGSADIDAHLSLAAGVAPAPGVHYAAIDRQPARIFFLLVARPGERTPYLQALAYIARLMKNEAIHQRLLDAPSAAVFYEVLRSAEP